MALPNLGVFAGFQRLYRQRVVCLDLLREMLLLSWHWPTRYSRHPACPGPSAAGRPLTVNRRDAGLALRENERFWKAG